MKYSALLKERGQNESRELLVLTRTPLGPGLPSGPAEPCNKGKTLVRRTHCTVHASSVISHGEANLNTSDSEMPDKEKYSGLE